MKKPSIHIVLSFCVGFILLASFIAFKVYQQSNYTKELTQTIANLSDYRTQLIQIPLAPDKIDQATPNKFLPILKSEVVSNYQDSLRIKERILFNTTLSYSTPRVNILKEIIELDILINALKTKQERAYNKLHSWWLTGTILGSIGCLFAFFVSYQVFNNLNKTKHLNVQISELKKAKQDAELATESKTEFLNVMSHEIRTPLNAVIGLSNILMQSNPNEDQKKHIQLLQFSSENLLSLINDILDFGKIESDKVVLEERPFNIDKQIKRIVSTLESFALSKDLTLHVESHINDDTEVIGDPTRIGQVIFNLVNNAIKFTNHGWIKVVITEIKSVETSITYKVEIKDSGIGIAKDKQRVIFEKFKQANAQTNRKYGGSGLGLTISQKLLELMNSGLLLKSEEGKGTEFSFQITLQKHQQAKQNTEQKKLSIPKQIPDMKVLIVEDNKINILILQQYIKTFNLEFDSAYNGIEAVELAQKNKYDIVLMDLQMPEMDGYTASQKIAELYGEEKPPILAISAANESHIRSNLNEFGIEDYITKPIDPEALNEKITKYLKLS